MYQVLWKLGMFLVPLLPVYAGCGGPINLNMQADFYAGYREDSSNWNIAGINGEPNILSELEWKDIKIKQVGTNVRITGCGSLYLRGFADYGWIYKGHNQDSDYWGNDRTDEFARSINQAGRGEVYDISIGGGYQIFRLCGLAIAPVGGYGYMRQHLHMYDGIEVINAEHPEYEGQEIPGLDSTYRNRWKGLWTGVDVSFLCGPLQFYGEWEYHWTHFDGTGNWNLRRDFCSPLLDHANGHGTRVGGNLYYFFCSCVSLGIGVEYWTFCAENGDSNVQMYVDLLDENGNVLQKNIKYWAKTPFNEVNWHSFRLNGILSVSF